MFGKFLTVLTATLVIGAASQAATLDFTGLPDGNLGTTVAVDGVTFEGSASLRNKSDDHFSTNGGAICAQKGSGDNCKGRMNVKFNGKVRKLSFASADYQAGDVATIVVYRGANVVGSTGVAWNGKVDLSIYKRVTRIKIAYEGVEDGLAYGKFNFIRVTSGKVSADAFDLVSGGSFLGEAFAKTPGPTIARVPGPLPSPVPLPAGIWLLAGAGGLLLTVARRPPPLTARHDG